MTENIEQQTESSEELEGSYLSFILGEENFCIELLKVLEIIGGRMPITQVPTAPNYIKGVSNLRGKVIPVIDLRSRFGMEMVEANQFTCTIIIKLKIESQEFQIGVIVDAVSEMLSINEEKVMDTTAYKGQVKTEYITGIASVGKEVKTILNIEKILCTDAMLEKLAEEIDN